jgi:hypothetical protein
MLDKWKENIMLFDSIVGILIGVISTSVSTLLITNLQLLTGWLVVSTGVILAPVLWWMPFISEQKRDLLVQDHIKANHPRARMIEIDYAHTVLVRWNWIVSGSYREGQNMVGFAIPVNSKCGNIRNVKLHSFNHA